MSSDAGLDTDLDAALVVSANLQKISATLQTAKDQLLGLLVRMVKKARVGSDISDFILKVKTWPGDSY
jgi:hypothetical protein